MNENDEKMYMRTLKDMKAEGDVYIIDHAWTFKQRSAHHDLKTNDKLLARMENLMKFSEKKDMEVENPYKVKVEKPTLESYLKKVAESSEPLWQLTSMNMASRT